MGDYDLYQVLKRIAEALERLAPGARPKNDLTLANAFVWHADTEWLQPVARVSRVDLKLLKGIDRQINTLKDNTHRFANGLPANNALLWGARGTGKSSLVKAIHTEINGNISGIFQNKIINLIHIHL